VTGETVAIIPARGGSQGVPRKNVARIAGIPLVARAVRAAARSGRIDRVVVSTDDTEIADAATAAGAEIVWRPADISGHLASSEAALLHALDDLAGRGVDVGVLAFLQATSPFTPAEGLGRACELVASGEADSAFSARESYEFFWTTTDGLATALGHDAAHRPRRQDREPAYVETGAFYVMDAAGFREARHRFFGRTRIVEVPASTAIEIDTPEDLAAARALAPVFERAEPIDALAVVTDFDGVHTDDTAFIDSEGHEFDRVSREDGMGVTRLRSAGIPMLIISTETNAVVGARGRKLKVPVLQAIEDKATTLTGWADDNGIPLDDIAYLGNDVNDLGAMGIVGWPIAVADARPEVRAAARLVLERVGGDGAVRELIERVLAAGRST
jgi:N-acylneuraminate cytidylyltransferase